MYEKQADVNSRNDAMSIQAGQIVTGNENEKPLGFTEYSDFGNKSTIFVYLAFGVLLVSALVFILFMISDIDLIHRISDRISGFWEPEVKASDDRLNAINWIQFGLMIMAAIIFLVWVYRAHKNLAAFNVQGLKFSSGNTVIWFFIPIFNFFMPYLAVSEIWKASSPDIDTEDSTAWKRTPFPKLVAIWWSFYTIAWIARIAIGASFRPDEPTGNITLDGLMRYLDDLLANRYAVIALECIFIVGFIITILLVRAIDQRQKKKYKLLKIRQTIM